MHIQEPTLDSSGFVVLSDYVPSIVQEIRYHSTFNFVGDRVDGYEEPIALSTLEAARALRDVSKQMMAQGLRLKIFDAYRPAMAVRHFIYWAIEDEDMRMKPFFYPNIDKEDTFALGYIAKQSSHTRGSTFDLTLLDMASGRDLDMGSPFDLFDEASHPDYRGITEKQYENRMLLRDAMVRNGFAPHDNEWWHYTLIDEPFPDTYFEFPVAASSLRRQ